MAGTCPHCGIRISGQLRRCPQCNEYCHMAHDVCPECGTELEHVQLPQEEEPEEVCMPQQQQKKSHRSVWPTIILVILILASAGTGGYYYTLHLKEQKEREDYERLEGKTNPEFYQQFLVTYPESPYYQEIEGRMQELLEEKKDWEQLLRDINRSNVLQFLQKHPNTLRQRTCESLLDSIDWLDALTVGSEEAISDYLQKHPAGRYAGDAADKKNVLLLTKVTASERTMIRGTLETFFSKVIANQDAEAARAAVPDTMINFCGKEKADIETILQFAQDKKAKDVLGLHYDLGQQMSVRKETLPDGNTGFSVEVSLQETISRSDVTQPLSNVYNVNALINQDQKIVRMFITK